MLLRHVLSVLQREPPPGASEDGGDASAPGPQQPRFRLIMLDGHVLRDDAEALREISRQLSLNIDTDAMFGTDGVVMGGSDTAADLAGGGAGAGPATPGGAASVSASSITKFTGLTGPSSRRYLPSKQARKSFDQHLSFVVGAMRDGRASNVPVVLVLDHFEGFAESRKQTLLYNLFDLTQSASVQVAVIGLTSRLDAVDMLEKRLKSRFSHRQLLFTTPPVDVVKQVHWVGRTSYVESMMLTPRVAGAWACASRYCSRHYGRHHRCRKCLWRVSTSAWLGCSTPRRSCRW